MCRRIMGPANLGWGSIRPYILLGTFEDLIGPRVVRCSCLAFEVESGLTSVRRREGNCLNYHCHPSQGEI